MKYNKFCYYKMNISSLTKKEIESPYLVLDELCTKRSMEDFQNGIWEFQKIIFKDGGCKDYDPATFYILCNDLLRLTDCLWLINKYSPGLSSPLENKQAADLSPTLMDEVNTLFPGTKNKTPKQEGDKNKTVLNTFFENHDNGFNRTDIYSYLQLGLDASYMRNSKYEYFNMEDNIVASEFSNFSGLIAESYKIYQYEPYMFPDLQACKEIRFAVDRDHPTHLSDECLINPSDPAEHFFYYYLDIKYIQSGLNAWKKILYEKDFWKKANNPGNLVYLTESLSRFIDTIWLMWQNGDLQKYADCYKAKAQNNILAKNCSPEEQANPFLAIHSFFTFKKLHEWKLLLNKWLMYSLSNTERPARKNKGKIKSAFNLLLKFAEAAHLLIRVPAEA